MSADARERRPLRPAWAAIDLAALEANLGRLRRAVGEAGVLAVVKADAYGHGAVPVARRLAEAGVDWLGVANADEGIELRRAGLETPILVLGVSREGEPGAYREHRLTPLLSSRPQVELWRRAAADWRPAHAVHLKVDTGMTRLGLAADEAPRAAARLAAAPGLRLAGLASHLAEAETTHSPANAAQERAFAEVVAALPAATRSEVVLHLANSAGALRRAAARHGMVRLGLALYGVDPSGAASELEPVLSVGARIALLREVGRGARVGYGGTWTAPRPSRLAVVPVGYADGYPWRLSNRGEALVGGRRVPIVGRVSMDMVTLDVTETAADEGDEAVLLGRQGEAEIGVAELAERAGTIPWETLCLFGLRLPRRYAGAAPPTTP